CPFFSHSSDIFPQGICQLPCTGPRCHVYKPPSSLQHDRRCLPCYDEHCKRQQPENPGTSCTSWSRNRVLLPSWSPFHDRAVHFHSATSIGQRGSLPHDRSALPLDLHFRSTFSKVRCENPWRIIPLTRHYHFRNTIQLFLRELCLALPTSIPLSCTN